MFCRRDRSGDALLAALSKKGINLLLPPQASMEPGSLMVLDGDGGMRRGDWTVVLGMAPAARAEPSSGFRAISFDAASQLDVSFAAKLLGRLLSAFGATAGKLDGAYSGSSSQSIELSLVAPASRTLEDSLDVLLQRLRDGGAKVSSAYEGRRLFVVTTAWRAKGLRLRLVDRSGKEVKLDAEILEELSGGGKLAVKQEVHGAYAFLASTPQVFGLGLRELRFENGILRDEPVTTHHNLRKDEEGPSETPHDFVGEDAFVEIVEV